ncbi:TPA: HEAT repeat domain-containing protein [Escherichia coli]|nr:HEAT repeat domain-containing protein [Escherichia coli]EFK7858789.1 HEAT repeat domain-containing protein [Escherichia coli]HCN5517129.1 HEAT repeat domain-containing protein [Escherichia coli]HDX5437192.1 HEAT repeat domain-containing protein [Escherichia coli]
MNDKKIKWTEQIPENIDELKKKAGNKNNYQDRISAINSLKKFKCRQSIDILRHLMKSDLVYIVKEEAFRALQAFDEDVKLPKKKKGHLIKDINKKVIAVGNTFNGDFEIEEFKVRFKQRYPEAYDVYQFEKKKKFDEWIINTLKSAPKK